MLGPTGAGKIFCIYTFWRAINEIPADDEEIKRRVKSLRIGWTVEDKCLESNQPQGMHGTHEVTSFIVREASPDRDRIVFQGTYFRFLSLIGPEIQ